MDDDVLMAVLSTVPFVLMIAACLLRATASMQPETSWSNKRRFMLFVISIILNIIAFFGMFLLFLTSAALAGFIGLFLLAFLFGLQTDAEVRIAGARSRAQQVELVWLLAIAVKSGRPLANEVEAYAQGTWGSRHRQLTELSERLRDGMPLTELAVPQGLMPRSAEMQIHAGINSASLQDSLRDAATRVTRELTEDQETTNVGAILYPVIIIPVTFLIVGFLMYYIMPKFKKIFDDFGTELPGITIGLIQLSDMGINYWYIFLLPVLYIPLIIYLFALAASYHGLRPVLQSFLGGWFVRWHTPDVMRALAHGIARGIPLSKAIQPIARHPGPLKLRTRLAWSVDQIDEGAPSWRTLQSAGILRHYETLVLESAERTGNLPWVLNMLATNIERHSAFRLAAIMEFVRPAILLGMSFFIGFIAIAMFMPLIKLLNDLS